MKRIGKTGVASRLRGAPTGYADTLEGVLYRFKVIQQARGVDKRFGPHPRRKKVTLPHVSLQDEDAPK
jgi:hypothetical protein